MQKAIEELHRNWPRTHISIEDSGIGFPIRQGVNVPDSKLHGYNTTGLSKPRMLAELQHLIELNHLRYDPNACPELDRELRAYRLPDTALTQDCVISLAIAIAGAVHALNPSGGRILAVVRC